MIGNKRRRIFQTLELWGAKRGLEFAARRGYTAGMKFRLLLAVFLVAVSVRGQSIEELRRKADTGDAAALDALALAYWNGNGVKRDEAEADRLVRLAAEKGWPRAQCAVGYNYEKGIRVKQDYKIAMEWYRRAADQNNALGFNNVGSVYLQGLGVPKDEAEAIKWFRRSADLGLPEAQNQLGIMCAQGQGTKADPVEAFKWFYISARQGYPPARDNVEKQTLVISSADKERSQRDGDEFIKSHHAAHKEMGTGFFITADGYVLTCYHVVMHSVRLTVRSSGESYEAELVKTDDVNDLALLKVKGKFHPLPLASSRDVRLGEGVFTIGFPNTHLQGISPKLTDGTINSLTGELDCPRYFQINAAAQPGNSGGPLVNLNGNVVGVFARSLGLMRTTELTGGAIPQGVNYAIKSSYALAFLESVPGLADKLAEPRSKSKRSLEDLAPVAQDATVFIIAD